jgi:hypothetical protein
MKHEEIERVEVYYERIHKLTHGSQLPTTNNFLTIVFRACLKLCFRNMIERMKKSTLQ